MPEAPETAEQDNWGLSNAFLHISEKELAATVIDYAKLMKWMVFFTWRSIHSPKGELDLRLIRPPRVIFAELKTEKGKLTPAQTETIEALKQCPGVDCFVWRPSHWDEIQKELA